MTPENLILLGVAAVALAAAVAAFAIAWRRSSGDADWRRSLQRETLEADRHRPVEVPAVPAAEEEAEEAEAEAPESQPARAETTEAESAGVAVATEQRLVEVSAEEAGVTRRQFFNRALSASFFTFLGVLGLQFLAFLWPRLSGGFGADVVAGKVSDLLDEATNDDGTITPVFIPEGRAYVVPAPSSVPPQFQDQGLVEGGVFALFQRCVHLGCRVPWCDTSQGFECPCHGSKYNAIGEYFAGPAPRNLDRFVIEVTDTDDLIIKTGQIIQTPRSLQLAFPYPQGPSCIGDVGGGEA